MKKLIDILKSMTITGWAIVALCVVVSVYCIALIFGGGGSAVNEHRISKLESEKQQALKAAAESRDRELILQGQIKAKDEVIKSLTSRIADSETKVVNAHNETQGARSTVNKVRADKPYFNSADDAGRIDELRTGLRELYPDTP
jgi:septal ring factor EnvC (AmiA/AmiB activator)